ncbi:glycosyl transferase family 2 [Rhodoferax lacus]|uniref:Glycosyl transferase family 2 n=1 Tax=Rhodoferax lacus TaxID=2184758 RepID=A0A3E1R8X1_9BURK|nr:glycosyltransferase family 2 protein [Rhodoferax lacus]RFO95805.1 glycosyl transferase family 2 [Rhodoferax lacus]
MSQASNISVLILTKNEQQDLPGCLTSVQWSDDVHVLDSHSTDDTVALAQAAGAHTTLRAFDGYASQRNFGLRLPFKHQWVLIVDADERIPASLVAEMQAFATSAPESVGAARMRRRDIWWDTWLRHAQISPFYVRLVKAGRAHYEREVNEVLVVDGDIHDLNEAFDHYPFSKGLDHWIAKHNVYSRMEAEVIASGQGIQPSWKTALFGRDFNERRGHQKAIFYRLPGRPLIKFLYMLVVRRAFLDGAAGIRYASLQAIYEYMIVLKVKELSHACRTTAPKSVS